MTRDLFPEENKIQNKNKREDILEENILEKRKRLL